MTTAFIGFGSNLGSGQQFILSAWKRLASEATVDCRKLSSLYISEPVGMASHFLFTNAVGMVETELGPLELLHLLLQVEIEHGRLRATNGTGGYLDRTLDLDLLYFGDTVLSSQDLFLPHPYLASRLFVLTPLNEIAPEFQDPLSKLTVEEMYRQLLALIQQEKGVTCLPLAECLPVTTVRKP
jgi:2-amino-4-hydroxy-6-hydroxymethyldihydropteridine diphosphokinase